jgi:peptidoglycan/LPS O-acetylase OafA/YrhL
MGIEIVNSPATEPHRYPVLDSLRGVAAVGVLLTHSFQTVLADGALNHTPLRIFANGRCFVIFFFVLSGFVLASAIWNDRGRTGYATYVARRLVRLYPPYLVAGIMAVLAIWLSGRPWDLMQPIEYALTLGTTTGIAINQPSWSLVYEIRLSLVMPLFCLLIGRNFKAFAGATAVLFVLVEIAILAFRIGQFPYGLNDITAAVVVTARFGVCFAVGAILARCVLRQPEILTPISRRPGLAALLALLLMSVLLDQTSILGAVLIIVLALQWPRLQQLMGIRLFVWLGRISYSLYLTHMVVLGTVVYLLQAHAAPIVAVAVVIPLALALAELFYRLVEAPTIGLSRRIGRRRSPAFPAVATATTSGGLR